MAQVSLRGQGWEIPHRSVGLMPVKRVVQQLETGVQ